MDEQKDLQGNTPLDTGAPVEPLPEIDIPNLRTYKSDISNTVNKDKITTAKILISEQKKKEKQEDFNSENSITRPKNTFALVFGVFFGLGALGLLGFFGYTQIGKTPQSVEIVNENLFVFSFDEKKLIDVEKPKIEVYQNVKDAFAEALNQKDNTYTDIVFYKTDAETKQGQRITSAQFFTLYDIRLPSDIARSISRDFVYGIYHNKTKTEPFLIIGLADYETAFDSMFDWEDTLASDLEQFFPAIQKMFAPQAAIPTAIPVDQIDQATSSNSEIASSTKTSATTTTSGIASTTSKQATSTPQITEEAQAGVIRRVEFTDIIFSNKDTRTARDKDGVPFFYYAFIERDKILFAQDPALLGEIVRKIKEKQLIR